MSGGGSETAVRVRGGAPRAAAPQRVSIALATYNGARYLGQQLDSFLAQTRRPDELVVSDDASRDGTLALVQAFARRAPFEVRISRNERNLGYARNFQQALALCRGDLIFLSDQDDVWFGDKIETMADHLAAHPAVQVLQADLVLTDQRLRPTGSTQLQNLRAAGWSDADLVFGCGTALRRAWAEVALPMPELPMGHDNWIHRLAAELGARAVLARPLQYYRRHDANASQWAASRPGPAGPLSRLRGHGLAPALQGWREELQRIEATRQRLAARQPALQALGYGAVLAPAAERLAQRADAYAERIRCCSLPRAARGLPLLGMYARGRYAHFSGVKSLLKDFIRP